MHKLLILVILLISFSCQKKNDKNDYENSHYIVNTWVVLGNNMTNSKILKYDSVLYDTLLCDENYNCRFKKLNRNLILNYIHNFDSLDNCKKEKYEFVFNNEKYSTSTTPQLLEYIIEKKEITTKYYYNLIHLNNEYYECSFEILPKYGIWKIKTNLDSEFTQNTSTHHHFKIYYLKEMQYYKNNILIKKDNLEYLIKYLEGSIIHQE